MQRKLLGFQTEVIHRKRWEREGIQSRAAISESYWDSFITQRIKEWEGCSMFEQMLTFIPKEKLEYWSVQRDLKTGNLPKWYQIYLRERGKGYMPNYP